MRENCFRIILFDLINVNTVVDLIRDTDGGRGNRHLVHTMSQQLLLQLEQLSLAVCNWEDDLTQSGNYCEIKFTTCYLINIFSVFAVRVSEKHEFKVTFSKHCTIRRANTVVLLQFLSFRLAMLRIAYRKIGKTVRIPYFGQQFLI